MDEFRKIAVLDNMVEAQILDSMLNEQEIPHMMKTYHDSAYDGLFQASKGWGHVEAPEGHRTEILTILEDLRTRSEGNPE
ncbi:MAG: hypothetical protein KKH97_04150 [Proteobacteria bacterium]|nr:hypothetical protein [Pseudomonadota bacterium]MBU1713093.1 hypothetical protein [Pseudomonadota bacterium]